MLAAPTRARPRVLPAKPQRVDWWQVITDLERAGAPHTVIAAEVGRGGSWVAYLKDTPDAEPRFHDGMLLIGLWKERTGRVDIPYL